MRAAEVLGGSSADESSPQCASTAASLRYLTPPSLPHPAGKTDVPPELAQELLEVADQYMLETL